MANGGKIELEGLRAALDRMRLEVAPEAKRFHELRENLARRVASELSSSFLSLWTKKAEIDELRKDVQLLQGLAAEIRTMFERAEATRASAARLRAELAEGADPELGAWLDQQASAWRAALARLAVNAERRRDLDRDGEVLAAVERQLRNVRLALDTLREVNLIAAKLGLDLAVAPLRADLPEIRLQLLSFGATDAWIRALEQRLEPLRHMEPPPPKQMPPGLPLASKTIREADRWAEVLELDRSAITDIELRIEQARSTEQYWSPGHAEALLAEAQAQLVRARAVALEQMTQRRAELEDDVGLFREACGDEPELERRIGKLAAARVEHFYMYQEWHGEYAQVRQHFESIAAMKSQSLASWIAGRAPRLAERVRKLRSGPLSLEVAARTEQLADGIEQLQAAHSVGDAFRALREIARVHAELDKIERQAAADIEDLAARRRALGGRHEHLQAEAGRGGVAARDLGARIAELTQGADRQSIEERRGDAAALERELDLLEREIVVASEARAAELLSVADAAAAALHGSGRSTSRVPPPSPEGAAGAPGPALARAVDGVLAATRRRDAMLARVEGALRELDARARDLHARLAAVPLDTASVEDAEATRELLDRLAQPADQHDDAPTRLQSLQALVEEAELRLDDFAREEREVGKMKHDLDARLRDLSNRGLKRHAPEAYERAAALIDGVSARTRRWGPIKEQLGEAARILDRVSAHAVRLAAAEVEEAARVLEDKRKARDPEVAREAEKVLALLAAQGHADLPPAALRSRAVKLAGLRDKDEIDG